MNNTPIRAIETTQCGGAQLGDALIHVGAEQGTRIGPPEAMSLLLTVERPNGAFETYSVPRSEALRAMGLISDVIVESDRFSTQPARSNAPSLAA